MLEIDLDILWIFKSIFLKIFRKQEKKLKILTRVTEYVIAYCYNKKIGRSV